MVTTYKIPMTFTFTGHVWVEATSEQEAREILAKSFSFNRARAYSRDYRIADWGIDLVPTYTIHTVDAPP